MAQTTVRVKKISTPSSRDAIAALIASQNKIKHYSATVDPASLSAGTSANTDVSVAGVTAGDFVIPIPPATLEAGVVVQGASVPTTGTIRLRLYNPTGGAVNPASATWGFVVIQNDQLATI